MDPATLQNYLANPPEGLTQPVWEQAQQDNPDPTKYVGVHWVRVQLLHQVCTHVVYTVECPFLLLCEHGQPSTSIVKQLLLLVD